VVGDRRGSRVDVSPARSLRRRARTSARPSGFLP
jgi:hypothetical protein